jgi:hypothetical protein
VSVAAFVHHMFEVRCAASWSAYIDLLDTRWDEMRDEVEMQACGLIAYEKSSMS